MRVRASTYNRGVSAGDRRRRHHSVCICVHASTIDYSSNYPYIMLYNNIIIPIKYYHIYLFIIILVPSLT